jgi:hypothetical protein
MLRRDFQELTRRRLREARTLFQQGHFDGAYYLLGLAVECALKACIAGQTQRNSFPDRDHANKCYTHDLSRLASAGGLDAALDAAVKSGSLLGLHWLVVKDWTVESRYELNDQAKTTAMLTAVTARGNGVMTWIRQRW